MKIIFIFTIIYLLFIVIELIPIFKSKNYKVFTIYAAILITSYSVEFATIMGVDVPSISMGIVKLVQHILE